MRRTLFAVTASAGLMIIGLSSADADQILLDNLDQPPQGLWNIGSVIGQAFTTGSAVEINSATFLHDRGGYVPTAGAYLTIQNADGAGKIGSTILDTWTAFTDAANLVTFSGNLALAAGTEYWLVLHDTAAQVARVSSTTSYTANFGASLPALNNNYESSTGAYYSLSEGPLMFQVTMIPGDQATTIPDSGLTAMLLGMGILAVGWVRRMVK